jgi:excisionase family DNA binding protein
MKRKPTVEELAVIQAKPVLTVKEAAVVAGVSMGTIYKAWKKDAGPVSFKIGRCRRISRQALNSWLRDLVRGTK